MKELDILDKKIGEINVNSLGTTEMFYYNNARNRLEKIRHHIINDNLKSAKSLLSRIETDLKVLESRLISTNLMKNLRD